MKKNGVKCWYAFLVGKRETVYDHVYREVLIGCVAFCVVISV